VKKLLNNPITANILIFGLIGASLVVFVTQYPYDNIWTMFTGMLLWIIAVAIAKIEELIKGKPEVK
jgi:hypothetical protein